MKVYLIMVSYNYGPSEVYEVHKTRKRAVKTVRERDRVGSSDSYRIEEREVQE